MSTYGNRQYRFSIHGQPWFKWRRQRKRRKRQNKFEPPFKNSSAGQLTLAMVANHDHLLQTFDNMKRENGKAPGPDGLSYDDYSRGEMASELRAISKRIIEGSYVPGRARQQKFPKSSGGHRILTIRDLTDRIVSKAIAGPLTTALDGIFSPGVMGFRPARGVWRMLAEMSATMAVTGRQVIAQCDIGNAFDNVPVDAVMADYRHYVKDNDLLRLIDTILRGHKGSNRSVGIEQGDPLSPLSLNLRLHHCLDQPFNAGPDHPPQFRYADNTVYLCRDVPEGHQALHKSFQLLRSAGLALKDEKSEVMDLSDNAQITILGFAVRRGKKEEGTIRFGLTSAAWQCLEQSLVKAHQASLLKLSLHSVLAGFPFGELLQNFFGF